MLKKSLIGLVVLLFFTQAKELNTPLNPYSTKGGEWEFFDLSTRWYRYEGNVDPLCIKLKNEFDKYKEHNKNIDDAHQCLDNVLDNFEEFRDFNWSEPLPIKLGDKNNELLYRIAKFKSKRDYQYYTDEYKKSDEKFNMRAVNTYHSWLNQNVQFQFLKGEFDNDLSRLQRFFGKKEKLIRLSFPDNDPNYRSCKGYPKRIRPNVIGIAYSNDDYTEIKGFNSWGRLFLYKDTLVKVDTGDGGETIEVIIGSQDRILSPQIEDNTSKSFYSICNFNF